MVYYVFYSWGWEQYDIMGGLLTLHEIKKGSIPRIPYDPLISVKSDSWVQARNKP